LEKLFYTSKHESDRFKTNNSSGVLNDLHISNALTTGGWGRNIMNALGESNCTAIDVIHNTVLNKMMLNRKALFTALL